MKRKVYRDAGKITGEMYREDTREMKGHVNANKSIVTAHTTNKQYIGRTDLFDKESAAMGRAHNVSAKVVDTGIQAYNSKVDKMPDSPYNELLSQRGKLQYETAKKLNAREGTVDSTFLQRKRRTRRRKY